MKQMKKIDEELSKIFYNMPSKYIDWFLIDIAAHLNSDIEEMI